MLYRNNEIPANYKYIADYSDNYIIWTDRTKLLSDTTYDVYMQFLSPSFSYIYITNYKITTGDKYTYDVNYSNNGMYSYIDSIESSFEKTTLVVDPDEIVENDYLRSDYLNIFIVQFIWILIFYWIFHKLSYLFHKGGI